MQLFSVIIDFWNFYPHQYSIPFESQENVYVCIDLAYEQ